jgi:hypothetical protein
MVDTLRCKLVHTSGLIHPKRESRSPPLAFSYVGPQFLILHSSDLVLLICIRLDDYAPVAYNPTF